MEGLVRRGRVASVEKSDIKTARDVAQQDISKLYLMSYYWTILAMTTVGNLPHPTTKVQYVYVISQLLGKSVRNNQHYWIGFYLHISKRNNLNDVLTAFY